MKLAPPARTNVIAVLVATSAALIVRAWLQLKLQAGGARPYEAGDLAYLAVPPVLLLLLAPVVYADRRFLLYQFRRSAISLAVVLNAVLLGLLLRITAWSKLIAGISFGIYQNDNPHAVEGPAFAFQCASPGSVALGFIVMAVMIPVVEEVAHRGYVQSGIQRHGAVPAILLSASTFAVFHPLSGWLFSFFAGLVLGTQYWRTGSLWSSLVTHATVNAAIQVDWRCLNTQWNPDAATLPLWKPGLLSIAVGLAAVACIAWLLKNSGTADRPAAERATER